jgi:adenosyl cobinamide kinase/adenosyl cobinamide phosphate guanylyltransferase
VTLDEEMEEIIEREVETREKIVQIADTNTDVAKTLLDRINEITPNFQDTVASFANKLVERALEKLDDKYIEAQDMGHLAKAVQTATDTVGLTQRFSSGVTINNNKVQVEGFQFVLDAPQIESKPDDVIDVKDE